MRLLCGAEESEIDEGGSGVYECFFLLGFFLGGLVALIVNAMVRGMPW